MKKETQTQIIQDKTLQMLELLKKLFDDNDIPFFLACGTALGCVRHKGFIPWDDDVDIYIKSRDYLKVRKLFMENNTENLILHDYQTIKEYPHYFPKIIAKDTYLLEKGLEHLDYKCGVYIDIFILQETSNIGFIRMINEKKRYFYYCLIHSYYSNFHSISRKLISKIIRKIINPYNIQQKLYNMYLKTYNDSEYVIDTGTFGKQAMIKAEIFNESINMDFQGNEFPMPVCYEEYLKHYYGNYMQMPPEMERKSNHNFVQINFKRK